MPADHYLILGVTPDATEEEIHTAWRRQVRYWHPDRNPDPRASRRIQILNHAHDVLSDAAQRSAYDGSRVQDADAYDDYAGFDDDEWAAYAADRADTPAAEPVPPPADTGARGAVVALLDRLEPLITEANFMLARPSDPPADIVDRWAAAATALVEQRLGWWNTHAQHLRMALAQGDPHLRLAKAQSILGSIRSDGIAGNIRPDV